MFRTQQTFGNLEVEASDNGRVKTWRREPDWNVWLCVHTKQFIITIMVEVIHTNMDRKRFWSANVTQVTTCPDPSPSSQPPESTFHLRRSQPLATSGRDLLGPRSASPLRWSRPLPTSGQDHNPSPRSPQSMMTRNCRNLCARYTQLLATSDCWI